MSSAPDFSPIQHITVHFLFFHQPTHKIKVVKVAPPEQTQAVTRSQQAKPLRGTQRISMNYLHHPAVSVFVSVSVKSVYRLQWVNISYVKVHCLSLKEASEEVLKVS